MTTPQIGIRISVTGDAEAKRAARDVAAEVGGINGSAEAAARGVGKLNVSLTDMAKAVVGVQLLNAGIQSVSNAVMSLPRTAFDYSKELESSAVGMAGILGSMASINGQQLEYNRSLAISQDMIRKLGDDALRTAASSQELTSTFQALLAPGQAAKMTLDEIRQLTVTGVNAVKSIGLSGGQVVQELRDLVQGGITAGGSSLATALGLRDEDIAKAKASSEGLFAFLMERLRGFEESSGKFGDTLQGRLDSLKEGAVRVTAEGMKPLTDAVSDATAELGKLFVTVEKTGDVKLNPQLVDGLQSVAEGMVSVMSVGKSAVSVLWENRDAVQGLAAAYAAFKIGGLAADLATAAAAKYELAQASRLAAVQTAAENAANQTATLTAREKTAALLAELQAQAQQAQAEVANTAAKIANLEATQAGILAAREQSVAALRATQVTMAQAEAQLSAARAAGAQSYAIAMVNEATATLNVAQARQSALLADLAMLGRQQAGVQAGIASATAAQTAATDAAAAATTRMAAAQGAASVSSRAMGVVIGALGGPVGIAIAAFATLIGYLWSANAEAEKLAKVDQSKQRLDAAAAEGWAAESRDVTRVQAQLEQLKETRDGLLLDQKNGGVMGWLFGDDYQVGVSSKLQATDAEIKALESSLAATKTTTDAAAGSTSGLTLTLNGAEQAWRKSIDSVKTATSIQADYKDKLTASQTSFQTYLEQLQSSGASETKIQAARNEQAQAEASLLKQRDDALKNLNGTRAVSASALANERTALQAKLVTEQAYAAALAAHGLQADKMTEADKDAERYALLAAKAKDAKTAATYRDLEAGARALAAQQHANAATVEGLKAHQAVIDGMTNDAKGINERAAALEAENAVWGQSKTAIEAAALAAEQQRRTDIAFAADPAYLRAMDARIAAMERYTDALREADYKRLSQGLQEWKRTSEEQNRLYVEEAQLAGLTGVERAKILATRQVELELAKRLAEIDRSGLDEEQKARLRAEAAVAATAARQSAVSKVMVDDFNQTMGKVDDIFRQGFADMLNNGKTGWASFTKSLSTTFKTAVADELYKAFARPFVVQVVAALTGITGLASSGGAGSSGQGGIGLGDAVSAYKNGSALWTLGSQVWNGTMSLANAGGTYLANATGTGLDGLLATNGAYGTAAGATGGMASYLPGIGGALGAYGFGQQYGFAGGMLGGIGSTALAGGLGGLAAGTGFGAGAMGALGALGPWGWAAIAGGALLGSLFGQKETKYSLYTDSTHTPDKKLFEDGIWSTSAYGNIGMKDHLSNGVDASKMKATFDAIAQLDNSIAAALSPEQNTKVKTALDGLTGANMGTAEDYIKARLGVITDQIGGAVDALADKFGGTTEELVGYVTSLVQAQTLLPAMTQLGLVLDTDSEAAATAALNLANTFGGIQNAAGLLTDYYQNFYSEQERAANSTRQMVAALADAGVIADRARREYSAAFQATGDDVASQVESFYARFLGRASDVEGAAYWINQVTSGMMTLEQVSQSIASLAQNELDGLDLSMTRAEFRALVDAAAAAGDMQQVANLLRLESAFAGLVPAAAEAVDAVGGVGSAISDILQSLQRDRTGLERQLLELQGGDVRGLDTQGYTSAELAAYDYNEALRQQIALLETAAQRQIEVTQERTGLERQLLELQGDTAAIRALERAALDASNQALYDRIVALQDAQTAEQAATQAAQESARVADQLRQERLQASASRLSDARNALQASYNAQAGDLNSTISAFKGFSDSIRDFRDSLLSSSDVLTTQERLQREQAQYTSVSSKARLGDQAAMGQYVDVAKGYLDAAKAGAGSREEYLAAVARVQSDAGLTADVADRQSSIAQSQLDALNSMVGGILDVNDSVRSVEQALRSFRSAVGNYRSLGGDVSQYTSGRNSVRGYASGGLFDGGLRLVGENGPELEVTGPSRIYSADQTRSLLSGGGNERLIQVVERMSAEIVSLKAEVVELRNQNRQYGGFTLRTAKMLEQFDKDGMPAVRAA